MNNIKIKNTWVWFKDQMTHPITLFSKTSWGVFSPYAHYRRSDHFPKQTHKSKERALDVAREMETKYGGNYTIYKCVYCDGWHVAKIGPAKSTAVEQKTVLSIVPRKQDT